MKKALSVILVLCTVTVHAQTPSLSEVYHMNRLMINTLDDYVRTGSLSSEEDMESFLSLFDTPEEACVFNDVLGTSGYKTMTTPSSYVKSVNSDSGNLFTFEISKVRKDGDFFRADGRWHRRINLKKYILYIDSSVYSGETGGVFFDTRQFYPEENGNLNLVFDMVYDQESDRCLISRIESADAVPGSALDGKNFSVVIRPEYEMDGVVLNNGVPLSYNDYGQTVIDIRNLSFSNDNYAVRPFVEASSDLYDVLQLRFKKLHHFRFKPRYSMTMGSAFVLADSPDGVNFTSSSKASEIGLDVGFLFLSGKKARTGLYSGAAYSSSGLNMSAGAFNYEFMPGRNYSISTVEEGYSYTDIMVPLYLETEIPLGQWVNVSLDLGAKFYIAQDTKADTPYRISGEVNNAHFDLDGFQKGFLDPGYYGKNPYDLSFFANLELDICVLKKILYLFASAGYEYGLQSLLPAFSQEEIKVYYNSNMSSPVFPVVYGGGENLLFRSLSQSIAFHRQSIWLSFGLKIKLNI